MAGVGTELDFHAVPLLPRRIHPRRLQVLLVEADTDTGRRRAQIDRATEVLTPLFRADTDDLGPVNVSGLDE
jgi:hypothetical protein